MIQHVSLIYDIIFCKLAYPLLFVCVLCVIFFFLQWSSYCCEQMEM